MTWSRSNDSGANRGCADSKLVIEIDTDLLATYNLRKNPL